MRGEAGNVLGGGPKELVGGPGGGCKGVEAAGEPKVKGDAGKLLLVGVAIGTDPGGTKVEAIEVVEAVEAGVGIGAPTGIGGGLRMAVGASSTKFFNRSFWGLAASAASIWSSGLTPKRL